MEVLRLIIYTAILAIMWFCIGWYSNSEPKEPQVFQQVDTILVINDTCTGVIKWQAK